MAVCPRCGEANPEHARFCLACGAPLEEPASPREMRKTVTVVFSDLIDSTPLGESLDAETYRRMLSRYFIEVSRVLEHHGGTVEKFIGDAIMAVFGIPVVHEDDALRAVRAVTDLREALHELNEELRSEFGIELRVRTGINTGEVVAGDPSEGQAFATGDAVAVAQRLETAASPGEILIGDATLRLVREAVLVEPLEPLQLKGKSQPVRAWRLIGVLSGAPAFARRLDAPMVGREDELERLRGAFDEATQMRECRVINVVGTAGIGKSRLVNELLASVSDEASVLEGRCLPYGKGITYWPLRDLVRTATAGELTRESIEKLLDGDSEAQRVAASIAGAIGIAGSKSAPEETMWAVRRLLEHLAREQPLVIAFDDLQWAEPTFLDLIEYLLGWTRDAPILIVGLARPDLHELHPGWLASMPNASSIALDPLTEAEAEVLLELLRGETELTADLLMRITDAAEGNPLFVEQMLAMLTENGAGSGDVAIPPSIHALLAARLDRLEHEERAVIERASVIGKEFWRGAITELTPEADRDSVGANLMTLTRKELISPGPSIFPSEDGFRFRHILIRDAAYLGIPKETRAQLHERWAGWLEQTTGERASELDEIIGYHLEQAYGYRAELGPSDPGSADLATRAGERLAAAGRRAIVDRGDASAAATLISRAVKLLPQDYPDRPELLTELGRVLMRAGDFAGANDVLTEALEAAAATGDRRLELRTTIEREFFRSFTSPEGSALDDSHVADEVIPELEALGDDVGLARAWWLKSEADVNACRWGARAHALERALEHARRSGVEAEMTVITSMHVQALYFGPTPVAEAVARCEQYLAENAGKRNALEGSVTGVLGGLSAMQGDFDRARSLQASARAIYEDLGLRFRLVVVSSLLGADIEQLAGRPGEAVSILRHAFETVRQMGATSTTATMAAFLADALSQDGKHEQADEAARFSEEHAPASDIVTQVLWRMARARALAQQENAAAEVLARHARALARDTDYPDLKTRTLRCLAQVIGPGDEQSSLLLEAREIYERKGNVAAAARLPAPSPAPS